MHQGGKKGLKKFTLPYTYSVQKIRWILKFRGLCTFDFRFFFPMLAHFSRMYVYSFSNIAFFLFARGIGVRSVLRVLAIFCCRKKCCVKFCVKNGIKCSKTLEMLKVAYGECTVSQKKVYKWYKLFAEGREEVNDDARFGRPSTSTTNENTEAVKKIVMENRRITITQVAEDVGISVAHAMQFFRIFWVWSVWQESSFQNCWILTKNPSHNHRLGNFEWRQRRSRFA